MPRQYTGTGTCASARPRTTGTRQQRTGTRQQFSHPTHAAARSSRTITSSRTCARASSAARSSAPSAATQWQVADPSALHTAHRARVASLRSRHLALPVEAAALGSACLATTARRADGLCLTRPVLRRDACGLGGCRFVQLVSGCGCSRSLWQERAQVYRVRSSTARSALLSDSLPSPCKRKARSSCHPLGSPWRRDAQRHSRVRVAAEEQRAHGG